MAGTNTLAYLASLSAMKEKSFITLTPGTNVIKLPTAYNRVEQLKGAWLGYVLALPTKIRLRGKG